MNLIGSPEELRIRTSVLALSNATELVARIVMDSASVDVSNSVKNSPITISVIKSSIQSRLIKNLDIGAKQ